MNNLKAAVLSLKLKHQNQGSIFSKSYFEELLQLIREYKAEDKILHSQIVEVLKGNNWLNGWFDYKDGDIMAIVNKPQDYETLTYYETVEKLLIGLKAYVGIFQCSKHPTLLFFNCAHYGCFVYDRRYSLSGYVEHLTIHLFTTEKLQTLIWRLEEA